MSRRNKYQKIAFLDKVAEERLVSAAHKIMDLIHEENVDPNTAIAKVASEYGFNPNFIQLLVQAHNIGVTNARRIKYANQGWQAQTAPFQLADKNIILSKIYEPINKAAYNNTTNTLETDDYSREPQFPVSHLTSENVEKVASISRNNTTNSKQTIKTDFLKQSYYEIKHKINNFYNELGVETEKIKSDIYDTLERSKINYIHLPEPKRDYIYKDIVTLLGDKGKEFFNKISTLTKKGYLQTTNNEIEKHAKELKRNIIRLVSFTEKLRKVASTVKRLIQLEQKLDNNFVEATQRRHLQDFFRIYKTAAQHGITDKFVGSIKSLFSRQRGLPTEKKEQIKRQYLDRLISPAHLSDIEAIDYAHTLAILLSDPVIKNYPKELVVNLFNELLSLYPDAVNKPALAKSFVRKYLTQGVIDLFDIKGLEESYARSLSSKINQLKAEQELMT